MTSYQPATSFRAADPPLMARIGDWLRRHQRAIRWTQWAVILVYATLLIAPTLVSLPGRAAHIWDNVTLFAQFVFWGIWWPGVLISMLLFGRLWCGVLCPEGSLSELASRHGRGGAIPRWVRWPGWPFTAFILTTVYGQMVSVYQYPKPALLILGGSTVAAIAIGYLYGRDRRVWCRYLCPVTGVFGLLAKLAPMHFRVDRNAWDSCPPKLGRTATVTCAPMLPLHNMDSASACHMCGRCAGYRDAIELTARAPGSEVVEVSGRSANGWESALIIVGLMGIAIGAFHWASSPWFVIAKQWAATWLVTHDMIWPLSTSLPWWLLTNYAANNDVLNLLDGALLLAYIAATAAAMSLALGLPLAAAARVLGPWNWQRFHHLAQALLPLAACGVILGLSAQTVTLLRADGFDLGWIGAARVTALAFASAWSLYLGWRIAGKYAGNAARLAATGAVALAAAAPVLAWSLLFWIW
ncbi:MAG: 4Fe-4S binding protein [Rhodobiaceae bacterium]|nr:4Fe-4S binding protein [Rhodobiaceae bacterium]